MTRAFRFIWCTPRNAVIAVLRAYQIVVSPFYGDVCRYYPSCSSYALQSVQQRGSVWGIGLAIWRVLRCHPWAVGGVDDIGLRARPFVVTRFGFVTGERVPASLLGSRRVVDALDDRAHAHSHGKS